MKIGRTLVFVLGIVGTIVAMRLIAPAMPPAILPFIVILLMAALLAFVVFYWRALDEAAREAQKIAWLCGGIGGVVAWALLVLLVPQFGEWSTAALFGGTGGVEDAYLSGAVSVLLLQSVGFTAYWLGWWAVRR